MFHRLQPNRDDPTDGRAARFRQIDPAHSTRRVNFDQRDQEPVRGVVAELQPAPKSGQIRRWSDRDAAHSSRRQQSWSGLVGVLPITGRSLVAERDSGSAGHLDQTRPVGIRFELTAQAVDRGTHHVRFDRIAEPPYLAQQGSPLHQSALLKGKRLQEPKLRGSEWHLLVPHPDTMLTQVDSKWADAEVLRRRGGRSQPGSPQVGPDTGNQLTMTERTGEEVVSPTF